MKKLCLLFLIALSFSSICLQAAWCKDYHGCFGGAGCQAVVNATACVLECQDGGFAHCEENPAV